MKIFKIVLIVLASLAVLLAAGLFIFLKTFDANKFLPQITQQASQAIGRDVRIGRVELGFSFLNGVGLQVKDVSLADDPKFSEKSFFTVDRIEVGLNVGALVLERKIQLANVIVVSPKIVVIRSKDGFINAATIGPKPAAGASSSQAQGNDAAALPALFVNDIKVTNASVTYIDEMFSPRLALQVDRIDVSVHDLSLTGPFGITVKAALFSVEQDVNADLQVVLDIGKQSANIKQMNIQVDLEKFDALRLENELPMIKPLLLKKTAGQFRFSASDIQVSSQGLSRLKGQVVLDKGMALSGLFPIPVENIQMQADLDEKQISVKALAATIAEGTVSSTAQLSDYLAVPLMSVTFAAQGMSAKKLAEAYKAPVSMSGLIEATGDMKFKGKSPEEIMASLNGQVKGELKNGVLENMNLLALGLGNIPMLPGLLDSVMPDLPAETQDEVKKGITRFETCKAQAHIVNGLMQLDAVDIITRDLAVQAKGTIKLVESVSVKADVRMDKDISMRLAQKVKELAYLQDGDGKIYLPVKITGSLMKPVVMPDAEYLTKKLLAAAGGEQLQKALGGNAAAAEAVGAIFDLFKKK
jgi:hypothetical protein